MARICSSPKIIPFIVMSSPPKAPLLPPSEQTRTKNPTANDVLCGRGGTINSHPGNEQYRTFVERKKRVYLTARFKREKRLIAQSIVDEVRKLDPPGRFLMKESSSEYWYDVGDEKARDKTSQALRENSMSVRRQMEEEFNATRRQQAREVAIAAGRDPDKAVEAMSAKPRATEPTTSAGLQSPPTGGLQPRVTGLQPPGPGFAGQSGYGPLYHAQQPNAPPQTTSQHLQQGGMHPSQYDYARTASHLYGQPSHSAHYHPPPSSYYAQQDPNHAHTVHPYPYGYAPHPSHHMMPPSNYDPNIGSNPHYAYHEVPARSTSPHHIDPQAMHGGHLQPEAHMMVESRHPSATNHQQEGTQYHVQQQDPESALRRNSSKEAYIGRHVQFESTEDSRHGTAKTYDQGAPQFPPLATDTNDIPLMIGAKKRSPNRHPQPRSQPYHSNDESQYTASPNSSPPQAHLNQDDSFTMSSPLQSSGLSHAEMSTTTPLTFLSNPLSLKTEDSLAKYLRGIEDEISGDIGQEVELVAHAPMLETQEHREQETIVPKRQQRPHGSISGKSATESISSGHYRGTPPRHHRSSRRRRKHRSGSHIPSNSGKVQLDLSAAAFEGSKGDAASPADAPKEGPCGHVAVSCGGMLPVPSPIVGRRQHHDTINSPQYTLSPNSLDIDKMSLCGTENISQGGSLIGGASLMNVFEEHESIVGANALMDMSVSLGSGPSSASSLAHNRAQLGLQGGDHDSLMGASALMDLSVGSASQSKGSYSGNGSKAHSSSSGSSSNKRNRRSLSPASIDKRCDGKVQAEFQEAAQDTSHGWTWDGKSKE